MAGVKNEFDNGIKVDGDSSFSANVSVGGSVAVVGDLTVTGNLAYNQTAYQDIVPNGNTYALGNTTARWIVYANTGAFSGNVSISGVTTFATSTTSIPSVRIPAGSAPTTPANGDVWATSSGLFMRSSGVTQQIAFTTSSITGAAATADTLTTARNIALTGEVTGNVNFNGSSNVSISTALSSSLSGKTFTGAISVQGDASSYTSTVSNGVVQIQRTAGGSANAQVDIYSGAATDSRRWSLIAGGDGILYLRAFNDAGSSSNSVFTVARTGVVNFTSLPQVGGSNIWHAGNDGTGSGLDADLLQGQPASYYSNATNLSSGTVPSARLAGTYNITVSGIANNSTYFNGQDSTYYTNIVARLGYTPINKAGDTGIGNTHFAIPATGEARLGFVWTSTGNTYYSANVSANTFGLYDSVNGLVYRHDRTTNRLTLSNANASFILQRETKNNITLAGNAITLDVSNTNFFEVTVSNNITTVTYNNLPTTGTVQSWVLKLNMGGAYSVTWPSAVSWAGGSAPTLPTGSGNTATIVQYTVDGGTKIHSYYAGATL